MLFVLLAVILSVLSMFIKTGTDTTESETIGIITQYGFPIHFKSGATGLAWARFSGARFWLNTMVWFSAIMVILMATTVRKNKK